MSDSVERACYGITEAELRQMVEKPALGSEISPPWMIAMSILSNCQEVISTERFDEVSDDAFAGKLEQARQWMNQAKWIIREYLANPLTPEERLVVGASLQVADPVDAGICSEAAMTTINGKLGLV